MRSVPRLVILALLGLFLAFPAAPAVAAPADSVASAEEDVVVQTTTTPPNTTAPSGPKIERDTEADQAESRRKLIMGATSVVLVGIVIWGRSIRRKRRKASEGG